MEKRLRKHLEDNSFFNKYQSDFRKSKSTNDHLFRLSQTIMAFHDGLRETEKIVVPRCRKNIRLPKYVSARLLHQVSGLPYVRERLITVGQNHLAKMHANPLVEHTINPARTNIA